MAYIRLRITKRITCHTLRHSFASHLLEIGENIPNIQRHPGHSSLRSTLIYLHVVFPHSDNKQCFSPLDVLLEKLKNTFEINHIITGFN
ncbi:MAG: tyrosine-type recombinase/integrase [Tannerella sp.]|nr:tyrosine-type recombinase/integrase [Tannerella sp.]